MKSEIEWNHVDDCLPVIPEGRYGVSVLVVQYDSMDGPDGCWYITQCSYATTRDRKGNKIKWFENSVKDFDFQDLYYGPDCGEWGPTGDPVVYWAYMPEVPKNPILTKKG